MYGTGTLQYEYEYEYCNAEASDPQTLNHSVATEQHLVGGRILPLGGISLAALY